MRDQAAHACRALCRARVAEELQRRGERGSQSTGSWCSASSTGRGLEPGRGGSRSLSVHRGFICSSVCGTSGRRGTAAETAL